MNSYNLCGADLLSPVLKKKCYSNDITVQDIALDAMRTHPDVPFAFVQSKIDDIQQGFYIALGVCRDTRSALGRCSTRKNHSLIFRDLSCSIGDAELDEEDDLPRVVLCGAERSLWRVQPPAELRVLLGERRQALLHSGSPASCSDSVAV